MSFVHISLIEDEGETIALSELVNNTREDFVFGYSLLVSFGIALLVRVCEEG